MSSPPPCSIAVVGAGLIGRAHVERILTDPEAALHAIVDPTDAARNFAATLGVPWHPDIAAMLATTKPDGAVIATPNRMHVEHGLAFVEAGVPVLIEKPLADTVADGTRLVEAGEARGVPVLTGHHRRHNALVREARAVIDSGRLGTIVSAHGSFWLMKPDDYFEAGWRRLPGAGPVLLNLVHDIDLMRHLVGGIAAVHAFGSNVVRGFPVEDTAAVLLRFANGALGTFNVSDTVVAPWSWEQTAGENLAYPRTDQSCYQIGGTHGSLSFPSLEVWTNPGKRSWWEPFHAERAFAPRSDALANQVSQFCAVICGREPPLVSGREGLETLKVIEAVAESARTGRTVGIG